jgi:hypothetical protein
MEKVGCWLESVIIETSRHSANISYFSWASVELSVLFAFLTLWEIQRSSPRLNFVAPEDTDGSTCESSRNLLDTQAVELPAACSSSPYTGRGASKVKAVQKQINNPSTRDSSQFSWIWVAAEIRADALSIRASWCLTTELYPSPVERNSNSSQLLHCLA